MKKIFTVVCAAMLAVAANAQLVIGGEIGLNTTGGNTTHVKSETMTGVASKSNLNLGFTFAPKVGYQMMDQKLEVGAALFLNVSADYSYEILVNDKKSKAFAKEIRNTPTFYFAPYARYRCFEVKGLGFWIEGVVDLGTVGDTKTTYKANTFGDTKGYYTAEKIQLIKDAEKDAAKLYKTSNFAGGLNFRPVLTYDVNEHWILETSLDCLSFGINGVSSTIKSRADEKDKWNVVKSNACTFDFGLQDGLKSLMNVTIGAAYRF